jgi:uncharacterized protein YbbK (DUF523 family)
MDKVQILTQRLQDSRGKRVVFLSHCLLNQNTRYLGGAGRKGCVREILEQCAQRDVGIVQMPCPEQHAWGGVTKRWWLRMFGAKGSLAYRARRLLMPVFLWYTRRVYRRLAWEMAAQIRDYLDSGHTVVAVVGIDGSPSCGLHRTLDVRRACELVACADLRVVTVADVNAIVSTSLVDGGGLFITALQEALTRRGCRVPFTAHDLMAEMDGRQSNVSLTATP